MAELGWVVAGGLAIAIVVLWRNRLRMEDRLRNRVGELERSLRDLLAAGNEEVKSLESVLDVVPQGLVVVGRDERVRYFNPAAVSLLGSVPADLSGISPPRLQRLARQARDSGARGGESFEHGHPSRVFDAAAVPVEINGRVLLVLADVTATRRIEAMRRDFAAAASHELKTPVAAVLAAAETLQMALGNDQQAAVRFAGDIEASARQLAKLVADLLDLSRLESGSPPSQPVRLDAIAADEVERAQDQAARAGVELSLAHTEVMVAADASYLALALRNLLDNAIRYNRPGGSVKVTVGVEGGCGLASVEDTGSGIPSRSLGRIFERFYRVDAARSRTTGGTGLGLAIVKHVAESYGGSVSVVSELGVGSVFTIRIPLASENGRKEPMSVAF